MATLKLHLLVDKEKNRVVFAESGGDFVGVLFSFLTLPMGTIVGLLGKQSSVGCLDKLYKSVENLDTASFETKACKTLLLQPRNAAELECENLKINIDDSKTEFYTCALQCHEYMNPFGGLHCPSCCGLMNTPVKLAKTYCHDGVFVEGSAKFIIRDDFQIMPLSSTSTIDVLQQFDIKSTAYLEQKTVDVGKDEVLLLLKMTLLSALPLSNVFLNKTETDIPVAQAHKFVGMNLFKIKNESSPADGTNSKKIPMKLLHSIVSNNILHAEVGGDLADLLFGFLTFPLGSVVKILNNDSSVGCLDNLYKSVEHLGIGDCFKSEKEKEMLLAPKLYLHHSCHNALVKIDEKSSTCYPRHVLDPKLPALGLQKRGFAKRLAKFAVSDDMVVTPLSPFSTIEICKELNEPISSLAVMEVSIGEAEALNLLKAFLISPTPLKELFLAKQRRKA